MPLEGERQTLPMVTIGTAHAPPFCGFFNGLPKYTSVAHAPLKGEQAQEGISMVHGGFCDTTDIRFSTALEPPTYGTALEPPIAGLRQYVTEVDGVDRKQVKLLKLTNAYWI